MVRGILAVSAFALLSLSVTAQTFYPRTDPFVFNSTGAITSWDGSDPANPPYPQNMGAVSLNTSFGGGYGSAISIPFQLGYLNDGDLNPCNPMTWGSMTWIVGDGTHTGDEFTVPGSTTCPYFTGEYGNSGNSWNISDGFSVVATYKRTFKTSCRFGVCRTSHYDTLQSGTGEAQQTEINPGASVKRSGDTVASLYRCGSNRSACPLTKVGK